MDLGGVGAIVVVLQIERGNLIRPATRPTDTAVTLGRTHAPHALRFVGFPDSLPPDGAALPGGLALQRAGSALHVHYQPDAPGDWLVYSFAAMRRAGFRLVLHDASADAGELRAAPHVAAIGDRSGQGVFAAGIAAIPATGLVALAAGDFGHGRACWHISPTGWRPEAYDLWRARRSPLVPLTPPTPPTLAR